MQKGVSSTTVVFVDKGTTMLTNDELEYAMQEQMQMLGGHALQEHMHHHGLDPQSLAHHMQMLHGMHMPTSHHGEHHHDGEDVASEDGDHAGNRAFNAVNAVPSNQLLQFLAQETRLFNMHLKQACEMYEAENKLPSSLFGVKAIRAVQKASGKKATAGERRKPTAFNLFIKLKMAEIKKEQVGANPKYTELFKRVVDIWGGMTPEEKKKFAADHQEELEILHKSSAENKKKRSNVNDDSLGENINIDGPSKK